MLLCFNICLLFIYVFGFPLLIFLLRFSRRSFCFLKKKKKIKMKINSIWYVELGNVLELSALILKQVLVDFNWIFIYFIILTTIFKYTLYNPIYIKFNLLSMSLTVENRIKRKLNWSFFIFLHEFLSFIFNILKSHIL